MPVHLEGPGLLEELALEEQPSAGQAVQGPAGEQRRAVQPPAEPLLGHPHLGQPGHVPARRRAAPQPRGQRACAR